MYGYSLSVFLPISLLCTIPLQFVRWIIVLTGGLIACAFITLNLRRMLEPFQDHKRKAILLMLAGGAEFGLAVALSLLIFSYGGTLST